MRKVELEKHCIVCRRSQSTCKVKVRLRSGESVSETHAVYLFVHLSLKGLSIFKTHDAYCLRLFLLIHIFHIHKTAHCTLTTLTYHQMCFIFTGVWSE